MRKFPRTLSLVAGLSLSVVLAACGGGGSSGTSISTGGGGGGGTNGPVSMNVLIPPGAQNNPGISQFVINNSQAPLTGATFQVEWSSIDNGTSYDWSYPDSEIAMLSSAQKANFVFWANADSSSNDCSSQGQFGDSTAGNCAIPTYVWNALTAANYVICTPSNANGPQRIPNYFSLDFQMNYQNFIKAAIAHYASNSQVGYIRFGLGRGGETIPVGDWDKAGDPCAAQFTAWGLTDATVSVVWEAYLSGMMTFEAANNPTKKQLMVGITPMNGDGVPDFLAPLAASLGVGFGSQGLESSDVNNCAHSTADWCNLFHQYHGQVPLELQTIGQSCPQSPSSCATGSLVTLIPFAVQNDATILEIYYQDWLTAFDPNYQGYDSSYAPVFTAAAAGQ